MQERHQNSELYFRELTMSFEKEVMPYIEETFPINENMRILEVGCGEGGNLIAFLKRGCHVVGVDMNHSKVAYGQTMLSKQFSANQISLIAQNIYDISIEDLGRFDLIILRDVIEHICDQRRFMAYIKQFLTHNGRIFFAFPPWYMPFGGHQQVCRNKLVSKIPYIHILPNFLYKSILKWGEKLKGLSMTCWG